MKLNCLCTIIILKAIGYIIMDYLKCIATTKACDTSDRVKKWRHIITHYILMIDVDAQHETVSIPILVNEWT